MFGDSKGQEWNNVHETLPQSGVGLDKASLNMAQEHLQIVVTVRLLRRHGRTLNKQQQHIARNYGLTLITFKASNQKHIGSCKAEFSDTLLETKKEKNSQIGKITTSKLVIAMVK